MGHRDAAYVAYISSPQWRAKRELAFAKYGRFCQKCRVNNNLDVHHATYERFTKERVTDLRVLCRNCHDKVHAMADRQGISIYDATLEFLKSPVGRKPKRPPRKMSKRVEAKRNPKPTSHDLTIIHRDGRLEVHPGELGPGPKRKESNTQRLIRELRG